MDINFQYYDACLYNQIEEAYAKVTYTYTTQIIHAERIYKSNNRFKWAQLILSAISTGGFIGTVVSNQVLLLWLSGISSTLLLILNSYFKDSSLLKVHQNHLKTSNELWLIREQYLSLLTDFKSITREEAANRRDDLQTRTAKIYENAPITDRKSYSLAKKALKNNESQFFSREEINLMLPEELRK